jgi:hypothetical protein
LANQGNKHFSEISRAVEIFYEHPERTSAASRVRQVGPIMNGRNAATTMRARMNSLRVHFSGLLLFLMPSKQQQQSIRKEEF